MKKIKLLLVDDEKPFLDTITKRLEKRELDVSAVYNGKEALVELENNTSIEVIILDVKMPGMDGIETLKAIKRTYPLVEVIMLTGHGTIDSAVEGLKSGATDYLTKPADVQDLIEKAEEAFEKRQMLEDKIRVAQSRAIGKSAREILRETGA